MKRLAIFLLCCLGVQLNAQVRYQKFYDPEKRHAAVEGMMTDDSVRTGQWTWWHQNGRVYQQGTYNERGEKSGTWQSYYEDGSKRSVECYDNGTSRWWYEDGSLMSEVSVQNGRKQGLYKSWYANGQLHEE